MPQSCLCKWTIGTGAPPPPPATQKLEEVPLSIRDALINDGTAKHSERAIRLFAKAANCSTFDIRCIDDDAGGCTFNERQMSVGAIARVIPKLRHRNVNGSGVFIRPCQPFAFADDVRAGTLERMLDDELHIAAVIETSPGSFQIWVPLAGPLRTIDEAICVAACERLEELYGTDPGVAHRDSFGRAPGFRNRKPEHDHDGISPLVVMSNRHSGFRGHDRTLLDEARRMVINNPQHLVERSVGAVLTIDDDHHHDHSIDTDDYLGPIEVLKAGRHVVTFSAINTATLYENWLNELQIAGYVLPERPNRTGVDRSQRDLDVLRSMNMAGVPRRTAQAALEAGSDKAHKRSPSYVEHLIGSVWGNP
jgi:hypothetical protein